MPSFISRRSAFVIVGLGLASIAPAPPKQDAGKALAPSPLAEARLQSALKQYELTWSYFQQSRIDSYFVYVWSRMVLDCRRDLDASQASRVAAIREHLARMKKLDELLKKVRRLGFARSADMGAAEYYCLEAEYWLSEAEAQKG
jgi:hypothetical protein